MERMLAIVFDDECQAYEGSHALRQLDSEGSIAVHAEAAIKKNADGTITVKQSNDEFPIRSVGGTALGGLIGVLEGPAGFTIGTQMGTIAGMISDFGAANVDAEFADNVAAALKPGKCAVIADVSEEWVTPVDTGMEALGGTIFRAARKSVEQDQRARDIAALREEIGQLKVECAKARADRRAKLKAKIDKLEASLQTKVEEARHRSERLKQETDAKVRALEKKAEKTRGEIKATLDARVNRIRQEQERAEAKLKRMIDGQRKTGNDPAQPA